MDETEVLARWSPEGAEPRGEVSRWPARLVVTEDEAAPVAERTWTGSLWHLISQDRRLSPCSRLMRLSQLPRAKFPLPNRQWEEPSSRLRPTLRLPQRHWSVWVESARATARGSSVVRSQE